MFWIVQENIFTEANYDALLDTLERLEAPHKIVKFLPFTHKIVSADTDFDAYETVEDVPEIEVPDGLVTTCGATLLSVVAKERGWTPGTFINENFNYSAWRDHWGEYLLNAQAVVTTMKDLHNPWGHKAIFVRPCHDTKSFTGFVLDDEMLSAWKHDTLSQGRDPQWMSPDTEIAISPLRDIQAEFRFFVVDGVVVTGSMYKLGKRLCPDPYIPDTVREFAMQMVSIWQPSRAFVLDIAETSAGCKIVEVNNFNSAGFYACNVGKIIEAVESMSF